MALQVKPDIKVVFNNTGVEYPETYQYRDMLRSRWDLNLIETKPQKNFWKCVEEYGFPLIRMEYGRAWKKFRQTTSKPQCFIFLKERPMAAACKKHGIEASLTGLRCAESGARMFVIAQRGQVYETKRWGHLWRYHPIALWTTRMVQEYLKEHDIPRNAIYDKGMPRSGCMPCTGFLHWEEQLAVANPKMYRWVQKLRKTPLIEDFIELENNVASNCDKRAVVEAWEGTTLDHWL